MDQRMHKWNEPAGAPVVVQVTDMDDEEFQTFVEAALETVFGENALGLEHEIATMKALESALMFGIVEPRTLNPRLAAEGMPGGS